ncbi:MAG: carboxypeptidase-like regulatory domain-containing protein [Chitinophagaceae bacterium]
MKFRIVLLALSLLSFGLAYANTDPSPSCETKSRKNDIEGLVIHAENKKPLKDVNITAYLISRKEKAAHTDELGGYSFDALKPGTYRIVFEKAGFKKVTKDKIVVKAEEPFLLNIEMIESKDFDLVPSPLHFADF